MYRSQQLIYRTTALYTTRPTTKWISKISPARADYSANPTYASP